MNTARLVLSSRWICKRARQTDQGSRSATIRFAIESVQDISGSNLYLVELMTLFA